jgi:hypothetical protein
MIWDTCCCCRMLFAEKFRRSHRHNVKWDAAGMLLRLSKIGNFLDDIWSRSVSHAPRKHNDDFWLRPSLSNTHLGL